MMIIDHSSSCCFCKMSLLGNRPLDTFDAKRQRMVAKIGTGEIVTSLFRNDANDTVVESDNFDMSLYVQDSLQTETRSSNSQAMLALIHLAPG